jgi:hypothetical protein
VREDVGNTIQEMAARVLVTQEQPAAWSLAHPAAGMRILCVPEPGMAPASRGRTQGCLAITWADAPAYLGIEVTEEILATFNGALADRHPPTARAEGDESEGV